MHSCTGFQPRQGINLCWHQALGFLDLHCYKDLLCNAVNCSCVACGVQTSIFTAVVWGTDLSLLCSGVGYRHLSSWPSFPFPEPARLVAIKQIPPRDQHTDITLHFISVNCNALQCIAMHSNALTKHALTIQHNTSIAKKIAIPPFISNVW